jgi:hypothetical protein
MQKSVPKLIDMNTWRENRGRIFCIGKIIHITNAGKATVDFPGNENGPIKARSIIEVSPSEIEKNTPVMLIFENENPALPIIVGVVRENLCPSSKLDKEGHQGQQIETIIDSQRMILNAKKEIVLRCGKSSVTLKKDGKIIVKGAEIVSRASSTNKIKGASVVIN